MKKLVLFLSLVFTIFSCSKESDIKYVGAIEEITGLSAFDTKIQAGVSIVFFHATWCPKCKAQRPAVEQTASDPNFVSTVFFGQVDFEKNNDINSKYDVLGFPTIVIFKNGIEKARFEGQGHSYETIKKELNKHL